MADTCGQIVLGSGLTVLSHPLMYIKVLVQVGARGRAARRGSGGGGVKVVEITSDRRAVIHDVQIHK